MAQISLNQYIWVWDMLFQLLITPLGPFPYMETRISICVLLQLGL